MMIILAAGLPPLASAALESSPFAGPGLHPRGSWSGFENHEAELGKAVAKAIMEASPSKAKPHDFSGREEELGRGVATVIRTLNVTSPYQHETNDALVKMTLNYIQFAKDHNLMREMLEHELRTEMPMLNANRKRIAESHDTEIALMAVTERTACFYQLAIEVKRAPGEIRYKSPFGRVLAMTRQLGQHTLTEQELHEIFTVPRLKMQAEKMGVDFDISPLGEDGWITIRVKPLKAVAG
jgi:hypothetical protein